MGIINSFASHIRKNKIKSLSLSQPLQHKRLTTINYNDNMINASSRYGATLF